MRLKPELAGDTFLDSAGYPVMAALMQMPGVPVSVNCEQSRDAATGVNDSTAITLKFSGGEIAHLYAAFGVAYRSHYAIAGTSGRIETDRAFAVPVDKTVILTVETDAGVEKIMLEPADQFRLMIEDFCGIISDRTTLQNNCEADLMRQQFVMDAVARSAREQRTIVLESF
jgi:NDP-hexose-3-ketoreductase